MRTIDLHGASPHALRHTFATMAAAHMQPKELQYILGHSDISTTMDVYVHVERERLKHVWDQTKDIYQSA